MTTSKTAYVRSLTDDKCDPQLGAEVRKHLYSLGLEHHEAPSPLYNPESAVFALRAGISNAFDALGLPMDDPSTMDTPKRFACMVVGELTKGLNYDFFPKCTTVPNGHGKTQVQDPRAHKPLKAGGYNQMVLVDNVQIMSLCEHHLQTIDGVCHIAYIPDEKVLGLSKFARVADFFARRPQIQERLTEQIFEALAFILGTNDIAVVIKATHYCMRARGAMQANAQTQTDKVGGRFFSEASLRKEFFDAIGN